MKTGKVYIIFCDLTGKAYVGQTWSSLSKRWTQHKSLSSCKKLAEAALALGLKPGPIGKVLRGELKKTHGHVFSYIPEVADALPEP